MATGELGWEVYVRMEDMGQLYTRLLDSGTDLELEHFGTRVINTLRIEKGEFILTLYNHQFTLHITKKYNFDMAVLFCIR